MGTDANVAVLVLGFLECGRLRGLRTGLSGRAAENLRSGFGPLSPANAGNWPYTVARFAYAAMGITCAGTGEFAASGWGPGAGARQ